MVLSDRLQGVHGPPRGGKQVLSKDQVSSLNKATPGIQSPRFWAVKKARSDPPWAGQIWYLGCSVEFLQILLLSKCEAKLNLGLQPRGRSLVPAGPERGHITTAMFTRVWSAYTLSVQGKAGEGMQGGCVVGRELPRSYSSVHFIF